MERVAIILAGGESWRLKPDIWELKPLLKINEHTLIERQIEWLSKYKFNKIIITTVKEVQDITERNLLFFSTLPDTTKVIWNIEEDKKGTSGAVYDAFKHVDNNDKAYVMNCDDLVYNYNPMDLYDIANNTYASILLSKPKIGFGRVETRRNLVLNFKEKPYLDFYVSAGHYTFSKIVVDKYFESSGDLELIVLPKLAEERKLYNCKLNRNKWITINTMKDYLEAKDRLE